MIDPVAFKLGTLSVRWYGLAWAFSYIFLCYFPHRLIKSYPILQKNWHEIVSNAVIASVIGGRLGEVLFYQTVMLLNDPLRVFYIWEGGLSFHGALICGAITLYWMSKKYRTTYFQISDIAVINLPIALGIVRVANFVNGELWGRVTDQSWGVHFPAAGPLLRHPSQLYEAFFEGVILWLIMLFVANKNPRHGILTSAFIVFYAGLRLVIECLFREPTFEWTSYASTAQILCLAMLLTGILMMVMRHICHNQVQKNEAS